MEQPNFLGKVRALCERLFGTGDTIFPRQSAKLHLVSLQERFGPSNLTGLTSATSLLAVDPTVSQIGQVASSGSWGTGEQSSFYTAGTTSLAIAVSPELVGNSDLLESSTIVFRDLASDWEPVDYPDSTGPISEKIATPTVGIARATQSVPAVATGGSPTISAESNAPAVAIPPGPVAPAASVGLGTVPPTHQESHFANPLTFSGLAAASTSSTTNWRGSPSYTFVDDLYSDEGSGQFKEPELSPELPGKGAPVSDVPVGDTGVLGSPDYFNPPAETLLEKAVDTGVQAPMQSGGIDQVDGPISSSHVGVIGLESQREAEAATTPTRITVTPISNPGVSETGVSAAEQFRISRASAEGTELRVNYQLIAYQGPALIRHEGSAVIPAGSRHVDVTPTVQRSSGRAEILTLTLSPSADYQFTHASATWMGNGSREACSDAALFAAFRHGQSQMAFQQLVERHHASVLRTATQILGNRTDAEDIGQFVFLVLARQQMTINSTLHYWLQKVTRNASIAFLRAKSRRLHHEMETAKPNESQSVEESHALQEEIQVALERLPSHLSEAVRLRYLEGWSQHEAAALIGCPRGTLSQRASLGLQHLRDLMTEHREAS